MHVHDSSFLAKMADVVINVHEEITSLFGFDTALFIRDWMIFNLIYAGAIAIYHIFVAINHY